jgi:hypothetical protein
MPLPLVSERIAEEVRLRGEDPNAVYDRIRVENPELAGVIVRRMEAVAFDEKAVHEVLAAAADVYSLLEAAASR